MKLSVSIMAHRVRQQHAEELQASLDYYAPIVYDPSPYTSPDPEQRWVTGRMAWEAHDPGADWHMVLQDDAIACPDLCAGLSKALEVLGTKGLVCAYSGAGKPQQTHIKRALAHAKDKGHTWWSSRSLCWGVAIIAPVHTIEPMLKWGSMRQRMKINYDKKIGMYYRDARNWRSWYTNPSLVDHRDGDSLVGHGTTAPEGGRRAHEFCTRSALDIDWTRTPPGGLPFRN